ncbi:MAG: HAD family hydrolase [Deltaproteobacteria bacterium]|nr:HAD family hydrolase [Deltaproteobacteria bacterium]
MKLRGIIFDLYGTLIDIHTNEDSEEIYRAVSHFLTYQGIHLDRGEVRSVYYQIVEEQRREQREKYPEFEAVEVWREFIRRNPGGSGLLPSAKLKQLPLFLAEMYRGISRERLELYPGVKKVLDELKTHFRLAVVTDGQAAWVLPEMQAVGIASYFNPIVISSDHGFRKPDGRLMQKALSGINLKGEEVLFVGNDMYRDIFGARQLGLKTVFFPSNQGLQEMAGVEPDRVIREFSELPRAIRGLGWR